jgi:2-polyprenyl-6-methoxyphenol hydroxylase-like FAD-dependent oxidoreductase
MLLRGLTILERLFPGIREDFSRKGAMLLDSAEDFAWFTPAGWAPRFASGLPFLSASRPLIEWAVRRRVAAMPNVQIRPMTVVRGLCMDQRKAISGIRLQAVGWPQIEQAPADLVIDASGRFSKTRDGLAELGVPAPPETVVNGHLGYASRLYRRSPDSQGAWKATYSQAAPPKVCRTGLAFPIEDDRWIVTLMGGGGDYPPASEHEFAEFARTLPNPDIYHVIRTAEPCSPIYLHRGTENRLRHWEAVSLPRGFAVVGDAACAFNPVYGQGMSTAAIGAELLDECLCWGEMREFQHRLTAGLQTPWMLATSEDFRYPGVLGATPGWSTRIMHWYLDHVIALSLRNTEVRRDLLEIFHLTRPPQVLFRPGIAGRVLWNSLFGSCHQLPVPQSVREAG